MTRILNLGQNNGLTVMILNLPPTKAFHLDTLSSLNFANRTKKIEVREIENEPIFKGPPRPPSVATNGGAARQPLRPLNSATNANILANREVQGDNKEKPAKLFSVYADKSKTTVTRTIPQKSSPLKRTATDTLSSRPAKQPRPIYTTSLLRKGPPEPTTKITTATLESLVEKKVAEILAQRAQKESQAPTQPHSQQELADREKAISVEVQARLDSIEKRLEGQEGERAEGLSYLFMAKQHQARGEVSSALRMYELAQPFFPGNEKLERKIEKLRAKALDKKRYREEDGHADEAVDAEADAETADCEASKQVRKPRRGRVYRDEAEDVDESYQYHDTPYQDEDDDEGSTGYSDSASPRPRRKNAKHRTKKTKTFRTARSASPDPLLDTPYDGNRAGADIALTPRTRYLIDTLNTRSVSKLKALNGLGVKKAEAIVEHLMVREGDLENWRDVLGLDVRGIGKRSWEVMREGVLA